MPGSLGRTGLRVAAAAVLVLALGGGYALTQQRQDNQRAIGEAHSAALSGDELHQLRVLRVAQWRAGAPLRVAQSDAQAKADAAAAAAASRGKAADDAVRRAQAASRSQNRPPSPAVPIPTSCAQYSGNQAIGCALMLQWGYGLDQMPCLVNMWNKESGWKTTDRNPSSGAYGIPQALPAKKMAEYGSDYLTNPATQIKWGLDYIKKRYKSPCGAWSFWQDHHWY